MVKPETLMRWTADDSAELYGVRNWGKGYFAVSAKGEVVVTPKTDRADLQVSLMDIVSGVRARGLDMPVLLRFEDILASRIALINDCFDRAIRDAGYRGAYRGVYPIKVNQQHHVVEEISKYGDRYHHGLEAGSKPELIAALAYMDDSEAFVVCNGYKDEEFIDLALYGLKMGIQTVIVLEMPGELNLVLDRASRMGVRPNLGVRVKLSSRMGGHWTESGGDRSVFGLNSSQVVDIIDRLRQENMLDCLRMLHYHVGSQIPNIRNIREALTEACRFYVDMAKEGARMGIFNVGGGLAVDYDGSHTNFASSSNYTIDEYAADIVEVVMGVCNEAGVEHPIVVSESGRATVAHHCVLLFNVLDISRFESHGLPETLPEGAHEMLRNLMEVTRTLTTKNAQECYNDAVFYRDEIRTLFEHGQVALRDRALSERIFWYVVSRIAKEMQDRKNVPPELEGLEEAIADIYYCNFSVFQSLPDSWAIEQLFPIMPIHRLAEMPTRQAILSDITCDCDGRINRFIDMHDVKHTLPLHEMTNGEYYLGVFLVGAYQETLGDLHNLFGDTNVINVKIEDDGTIDYAGELAGDTVADVLSYVEYDAPTLITRFRQIAEQAVRRGQITPEERREIMAAYETGLRGYTYFEP